MTETGEREVFTDNRPRIGITMGDAAGIGAEIILKALAEESAAITDYRPYIIGDRAFLSKTARELEIEMEFSDASAEFAESENKDAKRAGDFSKAPIPVFDLANLGGEIVAGAESALTGRASAEYIETGVQLWREGKIDAIATAPISKNALHMGGYDYPGHTEFLAHLTDTQEFAMSFFAENLRVVLLSTHVSLKDAINLIKKDALVELIRFTDRNLSNLLKRKVRIAVAGLNPHASENGMFGNEEALQIHPAIEECRRAHDIDVSGAFSPDTIFLRAFHGDFDAVVALYHDQATIAVKCLSFGASVNVTLGLPLVRTSVDHGTAFDIAGQNRADASSMKTAINLAARLVKSS